MSLYRATLLLLVSFSAAAAAVADETPSPPDVVLVVADGLGPCDLGCYGQEIVPTPRIDALAAEGKVFGVAYAGSAQCAPSLCTLLLGLHAGHAPIRSDAEAFADDSSPSTEPSSSPTIASLLARAGYRTACVGRWGLLGIGPPRKAGFSSFFGHLTRSLSHHPFPDRLWRNDAPVLLSGNGFLPLHRALAAPPGDPEAYRRFEGSDYAPDRMIEAALAFVRDAAGGPFFLLYDPPLPHPPLVVPEDELSAFPESWDSSSYLGEAGYLPQRRPRAARAALVRRLDRDVGRLVDLVDALGLSERTLFLVTSDHGPTDAGGSDPAFFDSACGLAGAEGSLREGGLRVPLIARWPGRTAPGSTSERPVWLVDVLPTLLDLAAAEAPASLVPDGRSLAPLLLDEPGNGESDEAWEERTLYFELGHQQAVRKGRFKLLRLFDGEGRETRRLFDLRYDEGERIDLARDLPEVVAELLAAARAARVPSEAHPNPPLDSDREREDR